MRQKSNYLLLSLLVFVVDQWSKWQIERHLPERGPIEVIPGFLDLIYVKNSGVAFGMFAANGNRMGTLALTLLGLGALTLVAIYFWKTPANHRVLLTSLALILGGAVGNLVDRIAAGAVTDFIDAYVGTYHWHTFNVADSAITVGIILMALDIFITRDGDSSRSPSPGPSST